MALSLSAGNKLGGGSRYSNEGLKKLSLNLNEQHEMSRSLSCLRQATTFTRYKRNTGIHCVGSFLPCLQCGINFRGFIKTVVSEALMS